MVELDGLQGGGLVRPRLTPRPAEWPSLEPAAGEEAPVASFGDALEKGLERVTALQDDVRNKLQDLGTGGPTDVHDVLIAMGKSEVAFNLMLEIRNRLVDSWREITRIQV